MLGALFHTLATPASWEHRRLGYLGRSVALWSRSRRCRDAWADHLTRTQDVIEQAMTNVADRRLVVVLGSGLLDDVPLAALARYFERVDLVDAIHPWPARLAARRFPHVRLVSADLSGAVALLKGRSDDLVPPLAEICRGAGFVVSANLLSQLPLVPLAWLPEGNEAEALGRRIVAAHLDGLSRLPAHVCVVTDVEQIEEDGHGRIIDRLDLLHGRSLPPAELSWMWELAPFGEVSRASRLRHRVVAYPDWQVAERANR